MTHVPYVAPRIDVSNPLTQRQIIHAAVGHIFAMNERCGDSRYCYYRMGDKACAFGIFIPDRLYSSDMECRPASTVILRLAGTDRRLAWMKEYTDLFCNLQSAHDGSEAWESSERMQADIINLINRGRTIVSQYDLAWIRQQRFADR